MATFNKHEKEGCHILCQPNIFLNLGGIFSHFRINCGASKQGNIIQQQKGINYWCTHQLQQIPKALCWVKETNLKGYIMYDFIYVVFLETWNCSDEEQISACQVLGVRGSCDCKVAPRNCLGLQNCSLS